METTYYVNDIATDAPQVLMTYDDQDNYTAAYSYGIERIKVKALDNTRPESQDPLYYLHDGLGSTRQLVRSNGAVRDHYNYDEFGVPGPGAKLSEDGKNVNHNTFGYTGEMWDEEDDLLYLRSRYYAPHIGRFMTRDVFPGYANNPLSMHKYAYVENSPVNFVDPLGFNKKEVKNQYGPPSPKDLYGPPSPRDIINQGTSQNKELLNFVKYTVVDAQKTAFQKTINNTNVQILLAKHCLNPIVDQAYKEARDEFIEYMLKEAAKKGAEKVLSGKLKSGQTADYLLPYSAA